MIELENVECNPSVHFLDLIKDYHLDMSIEELERHYKAVVVNKDLQLLPAPFGLRSKVSSDCRLQMVRSKDTDGNYTILKHIVFPNQCKASVMKQLVHGVLHRPNFMHIPTMGRKILQYCLQNMGGLQFRCFDLTADVPTSKNKKVFDELEDDDLDKGFDYISKHGLVQQALRQLSAEGALVRKEYAWPLALTPVFFHTWLLEILEEIWNFDLSALVMLGEPACGKSPLGRSVLMAQCRFNRKKFNVAGEPSIRCSPEIDFLRGVGDCLDDPCAQSLGLKALKSLLDVDLYESMSWACWGAVKWVQNQPRALAANAYEAGVDEGESFMSTLKFPVFWEMVRPCPCKEATKADVDAILLNANRTGQIVKGCSLFAESRPDPSCLRSAASLHEARVAIKREREESVERKALKTFKAWSIELKSARAVVDLDAADDDIAPDDAASIEAALEEVMDQMEEEEEIFDFGEQHE
ncbi:unnamed protein product [Cladocopium goreaui]|uniref:Uncharacterized protein n=1 Tax=Cladocopium goreaui TaxID=2562237 RepID=A0A9P1BJA8_9DINO|nr:unnamed protein product [Cladocopium goreaui]